MNTRSAHIRKIIEEVKKHIHIPNHLAYEAALESADERLLSLFNDIHTEELFSFEALSLQDLHKAESLEDLTKIIDSFTSILHFYKNNLKIFSSMIEENFFHQFLLEKGTLNAWNEIMSHSYKKLDYHQAKTLVIDSLSRLHSESESESHHFSHT